MSGAAESPCEEVFSRLCLIKGRLLLDEIGHVQASEDVGSFSGPRSAWNCKALHAANLTMKLMSMHALRTSPCPLTVFMSSSKP